MKFINTAKRFGAVVLATTVAAPAAFAAGPMDAIFAAVDLGSVGTWVGATGVVIVGIVMAFKGIDLSKRAVKKA
jgi:hypothetical protein